MKPTEPDIKWCVENRELVARWLEQRGGWQDYDWAYIEGDGVVCIESVCADGLAYRKPTGDSRYVFFSDNCDLWLPSVGDALEMLEGKVEHFLDLYRKANWYELSPAYKYGAVCGSLRGDGTTWLIALMELLKGVGDE